MSQMNTNGYPMSGGVSGVLSKICGGLPGGANSLFVRNQRFYHRVLYPTAGALNFTFFNVAKTPFITNFTQAAQLPANYGLALKGVSLSIKAGITLATGAPLAAGAAFVGTPAATSTALILAEALRLAHENATVSMWIGDKKLIDDVYGLDAFQPGRGLSGLASAGGTGHASNFASAAYVTNGAPFAANQMQFETPYPIAGGQPIRLEVSYQALIPLPCDAVITAELIGQLISPAGG